MAAEPGDRHLPWEGCFNVRDLGGHPTTDGGSTRVGAIVRSDDPGRLTQRGLEALRAHGVRSVVDLRDPSELENRSSPLAAHLAYANVPLLDFGDAQFWEKWRGRYDPPGAFYLDLLAHWPARVAAAVSAVARAAPGGVLVHCAVGRDRTGLVCALLLSLAGVPPEVIAADYALSSDRLRPLYEEWLSADLDPQARARLERENVSDAAAMLAVLDGLDAEAYLLAAGATAADLEAVRRRLREDGHGG